MDYHPRLQDSNALYTRYYQLRSLSYRHKSHHRPPVLFIFSIIFLALFSQLAAAADTSILMIKSSDDLVYNKVAHSALQYLEQACANSTRTCRTPAVSVESVEEGVDNRMINSGDWDLIVTIGTKAANLVSRSGTNTPTLYSLIPSNSFNNIRKKSHSVQTSAIFIDQPISRQLALVKAIMPERIKVGVILGRYSSVSKSSLNTRMHSMKLTPIISYATPDNINRVIEGIFKKTNVLLALPDPSIYNKQTVLTILLSSYRHRVPIIGYSAAFVKSGAIAAVYSTPSDIGHHIGDEIGKFVSSSERNLSSPSYPRYFSINVNKSVANSLNILMPSITTIRSRILKASK